MLCIQKLNSTTVASFMSWRCTDPYMRQVLEREIMRHDRGMGVIFIAKAEENIVGTAQLVCSHRDRELADGETIGCLQGLEVDCQYRKQGIATSLISCVEQAALSRQFEYLSVMVELDNVPAINLYQKLGFREFKRSLDYWKNQQYPVICLSKPIF